MSRPVPLLVLVVSLLVAATPAQAVEPTGPRLAISASTGEGAEVITVGPGGEDPRQLLGGPFALIGDRLSWSADGGLLAFGVGGFGGGRVVAIAPTAGGEPRIFPAASLGAGGPILAPDGQTVFFAHREIDRELPGREHHLVKGSIWSLDLADGLVRQRTKWRPGLTVPSSISPDGSTLAGTGYSRRGFEAVALDLHTGRFRVLAEEASEPTFSPDGTQVAFIRWKNWRASGAEKRSPPINELRVTRVGDFPRSRFLLHSRKLLVAPGWDPSGSLLSFTSSHVLQTGHPVLEAGDRLMAINADGTCLTRVFTDPKLTLYGSAWQPGPGRGAGPISC